MQHDGAVDLAQEFLRRRLILGDDGVGVQRAVRGDVRGGFDSGGRELARAVGLMGSNGGYTISKTTRLSNSSAG